jgi:hypothetical protein
MQEALDRTVKVKQPPYRRHLYTPPCPAEATDVTIDIAAISAVSIHYNLQTPTNEAFATSLYEINRIVEDRKVVGGGKAKD